MATKALISYDDTLNDLDALALGRLLAETGAGLTLAYVRHTTQRERTREELEEHEAQALLQRGARWLGDIDVETRVIVSASTGDGLTALAEHDGADIVVFGSDYRTTPGHVAPQRSAQKLLEGGVAAVAIAPANFRSVREFEVRTIGVLSGQSDTAALESAQGLAEHFDAVLTTAETGVDLLVIGSRPEAREGHVMLTSRAHGAIENAHSPVLVVPRGVALRFSTLTTAA
jgi:nucleotide-binding universal stress UspA family protein